MRLLVVIFLLTYSSNALKIVDNPGETVEKQIMTDSGPVTLIVGRKTGRNIKFESLEEVEEADEEEEQPAEVVFAPGEFQVNYIVSYRSPI